MKQLTVTYITHRELEKVLDRYRHGYRYGDWIETTNGRCHLFCGGSPEEELARDSEYRERYGIPGDEQGALDETARLIYQAQIDGSLPRGEILVEVSW